MPIEGCPYCRTETDTLVEHVAKEHPSSYAAFMTLPAYAKAAAPAVPTNDIPEGQTRPARETISVSPRGWFSVQADSVGRFFINAPDGTQEGGLSISALEDLEDVLRSALRYAKRS